MADQDQYEQQAVETLFHDIATPLLISRMKSELLSRHLPSLIQVLLDTPHLRHLLPEDQQLIEALLSAPDIMLSNLLVVQKKINLLSAAVLHQGGGIGSAKSSTKVIAEGRMATPGVEVLVIKSVLLVDDEAVHRDIGERLLAPYYEVDFARNGVEAISMCEQKHYDLILMDLHMPKMNGEQATIALRSLIGSETIIIGLTSLPIGANKSGLLAMGFTDFLEKPLKLNSLQKLLRTHSLSA